MTDPATSKEERRMWGLSLDSWNNLIVAFGVLSGVFVLLTGAATYFAFQISKQEAIDATAELNRYKLSVDGRIADAKREGIAAGKAAGEAEARASKVEEAARWRVLDPDTKGVLAASLASGTGGPITLAWPANDSEALFLAVQLQSVFDDANRRAGKTLWTIDFSPRVYSKAIFWSLRISGQSNEIVGALKRAFSSARIPYSDEAIPNVINDSPGMVIGGGDIPPALIWIGPKRPPN